MVNQSVGVVIVRERNWQFYPGICAASFHVARADVVQVKLVNA